MAEQRWAECMVYLGDEELMKRMQANIETVQSNINIPKRQRQPPAHLFKHLARQHANRDQAILAAYGTEKYSYTISA